MSLHVLLFTTETHPEHGITDGILIGDFNFKDNEKEEHSELEQRYVDMWKHLKGTSKNENGRDKWQVF